MGLKAKEILTHRAKQKTCYDSQGYCEVVKFKELATAHPVTASRPHDTVPLVCKFPYTIEAPRVPLYDET